MVALVVVVTLSVLTALGVVAATLWWSGWWALAVVAAPLLLLAIVDVLQRRHSILRNYPVLGHMRFLLESIRPELQQYFVERNFDGRPPLRPRHPHAHLRAGQGDRG